VVTNIGDFLASLTGPIRTVLDWVNKLLGPLKRLLGLGGGGGQAAAWNKSLTAVTQEAVSAGTVTLPPAPKGFRYAEDYSLVKYQRRGVITKPTLALLGEAGPEMVVSARGRGGGIGSISITNHWDASISAKDRQELAEMMELTTYRAIRRVFA